MQTCLVAEHKVALADIALLKKRIDIQTRIIDGQKFVVRREREQRVESEQYNYWHSEVRANPHLTDREKVCIAAYRDYAHETPKDNEGYFYYSAVAVAKKLGNVVTEGQRQGNKERAFHPIHSALQQHGYIDTRTAKQKTNKQKDNHFDKLLDSFLLYPRSIDLGGVSGLRGGKRVVIHKECGGLCEEQVVYTCTHCGEMNITQEHVFMVDEEEYENRQNLHQHIDIEASIEREQQIATLAKMDARISDMDYYNNDAANIPDDLHDEYGDEILTMSDRRLAELTRIPYHVRQGLDDDDMAAVDEALSELSTKRKDAS